MSGGAVPAYRVEFTRSARREFDALPAEIQGKIAEALAFLSGNPFSDLLRIKKLKGASSLYRIRIADWRIVYEVRRDILVVVVIKIGHRREVYRRF